MTASSHNAHSVEEESVQAVNVAEKKSVQMATTQPTKIHQAGDTSVLKGELSLRLRGGSADVDWDLVASVTSNAMTISLGMDVTILSVKQVARRLSANNILDRTVLIIFTAPSSAFDVSPLQASINQMLTNANLGMTVTSLSLSWCRGAACGTDAGRPEKSTAELDPLIVTLSVSGAVCFLLFIAGATLFYRRKLRSSGKHLQAATPAHVATDGEAAVKDPTSISGHMDLEIASNSTMEPRSEVSDWVSETHSMPKSGGL